MNGVLADQLQVWGFENDAVIFSDGSLGFGLIAKPLDVQCLSDDDINSLSVKASHFLNGLPSGIDIQFVQDVTTGVKATLNSFESLSVECKSEVSTALARDRANYFRTLDEEGRISNHLLKIFVRRSFLANLFEKPKLFARSKHFIDVGEEKLSSELRALNHLQQELIQGLSSLGISTQVMKAKDIFELMYLQWNPARPIGTFTYNSDDIRSSTVFTDAVVYERGFCLADVHHRILSLKLLPEQTIAAMARHLRDLPVTSRLFLTVHVPDQQKALEQLQSQRRLAFSMVHGKQSGVSDLDGQAKLQDIEALLQDLISQGEKIFHSSLNIVLRSKDKEELDHQVAQALAILRELGGAEGMEESLAAFDIFSDCSIPNARSKERAKRLKTSTLADFLPIYGPWQGFDKPSVLLRSRLGSLVSFDPFDHGLTNYNHVVSGGSGSGKSFFTNLFLLQMLKENPKIFIIDIGGSYKRFCDVLSGQYIPLGVNVGMSINPFDLSPGEREPANDKIKFLLGLIEMMTKEDNRIGVTKLERAELENAIVQVYKETATPSMSVLRDILLRHQDADIKKLGRVLGPWCGNTPFGRFVDRPTTIGFDKSIVCFDLKDLESAELKAVCLFIITDFIWREVQKDRSSKKFVVFDECWKLLESDTGSQFIGEVFRTFRKYFAGAIAISQNLDDFAKSKVATAILSNSSIKWILMQKGADRNRLQEVLQLNHAEMELISSLHQERGAFSEAFLMAGDHRSVVAIEPTSAEYWVATTDPRDLAEIELVQKANANLTGMALLNELASKYPKGVAASGTRAS